jgi:VWFA-related protein
MATLLLGSLGLALAGCGGGSSSGGTVPPPPPPPPPTASISLTPASFDFGTVTEGNLDEVPARRFVIQNGGTGSYDVSSIRLEGQDPTAFALDVDAGDNPCGAGVRTLGPGASCGVDVRFAPAAFGPFAAVLAVQSNDPVSPSVNAALQGRYAEVEEVTVTVSQIDACPRELPASVYVSVTDQGDFPIKDLGLPAFGLTEDGQASTLNAVNTVGNAASSISLSILMDYSGSIRDTPGILDNLKEAASVLVDKLGANDEADIIKYAGNITFMLDDFTSDKAELLAAIAEDPSSFGSGTATYDATNAAVERIQSGAKDRKAVILLTDGQDTTSTDLASTIEFALEGDVPVYTVGFGDLDALALGTLATETGGVFYEPAASDNLAAVYQQIANLLFSDQYVLSYVSAVPAGQSATVEVSVDFIRDGKGFQGSGTKTLQACAVQ